MKSRNHPTKNHPIIVVVRENEILITTLKGTPIASLTVSTSEKDNVPCGDFFLQFRPEVKLNALDKDLVCVKESD